MARFCTLASSSAGNCTYITAGNEALLVDAGISCRRIMTGLADMGEDGEKISAVLITHEHIDHIKGLSVLLKKTNAAVYATEPVLCAIASSLRLPEERLVPIEAGTPFAAAGMNIRAFRTPHDSAQSVGYRITTPDEHTIAVATDMGTVTEEVEQGLLGAESILLESNYDPFLLRMGPYPQHLKSRIASEHGHLANEDAARFICRLLERGTARFVLGHLSKENNNPALAEQTALDELSAVMARRGVDFELSVAPYDTPGRLVRL